MAAKSTPTAHLQKDKNKRPHVTESKVGTGDKGQHFTDITKQDRTGHNKAGRATHSTSPKLQQKVKIISLSG